MTYVELADLLRGLVPALETSVRSAPEEWRAELFELLAATYQACSAALAKLGEPEAAWIAAERAGNPLMMAASVSLMTHLMNTYSSLRAPMTPPPGRRTM